MNNAVQKEKKNFKNIKRCEVPNKAEKMRKR
jgi:hypothetical protein